MQHQSHLELNEDENLNRTVARYMLDTLQDLAKTLTVETVAVAKWLLSSLLAVNGAAAVATWPIAMSPGIKIASCTSFAIGVLLPLLAGYTSLKTSKTMSAEVGKMIGYWLAVADDGERVASIEAEHADLPRKAEQAGQPAMRLGWTSILAFVVGLIFAGVGIIINR
ncbi:hypothetical protein A0J57_13940 [Sphingobium sp. 22B]|uniref:hypothetical protein n=1 Tax=unclassified Sphingobium TaxID=2611147 RepID=UPI0007863ABF|nr:MULTISPECIES: hypothetical protein [unclassified Sphingobium]KXU30918.1 hypothetical protein AXW74_15045 [Sphingobium sp. AM]KYC31719.1 hypothetical protein A0J57_13940 [Sphingobium sp. 22B]OAP31041.1 hypothetical protein A8O16_15325 [Sphingobium sp. 20006FA]